ncbi:hypothetical protein [Methanobrevibacter sp.]|uniref:hypothetical protein n=1 Tax=Methanobrevibacter sp. TaxID=66852 RepID=UPI00388E336A
MLTRNNNIITLNNSNFNCNFALNEKQVQKRCIEYKIRKLISPYKDYFENLRKEINNELKKTNEKNVPIHLFYSFIYFEFIANKKDTNDSYLEWFKENFIFNQHYYRKHSSSYCLFLELEYKRRKEYLNVLRVKA